MLHEIRQKAFDADEAAKRLKITDRQMRRLLLRSCSARTRAGQIPKAPPTAVD